MSVSLAVGDIRRIAHGPIRKLFIGQFLNSLGSGLTLALLITYLHVVRDLPLQQATLLLAWQALLALAVSPMAGSLVDRVGPRPVLMGAVLIEAVGVFAYGHVTTVMQAFAAMTVVAIGGAGIWGPSAALTARLVAPADRATAFGFGFMLLNLGLGLGGLISATIVDTDDVSTFTWLYSVSALTYVVLFFAVLAMGPVGGLPTAGAEGTAEGTAPPSREGGWAEVLRDRTLLRFAATGLLLMTFGYGSIDAGVGIFIKKTLEFSENLIGVVFAANTIVIVLGQLFVLSVVKGRSRSRILAAVGVTWALSWLLFGSALLLEEWLAVAALIMAMAVFAVGETMWSPTAPALLNDLGPEHLRGRYNAFQSVLWGLSGALGPVITGIFLSAELGGAWTLTLAAGCLLATLLALRLRQHLTPGQDGLGESESPDDDPDPARPEGDPDLDPSYSIGAR